MDHPSADQASVYGHFDDANREYVVTEPLTPRPWINYVSNSRMGAIVSQGAGGLAWYHQPVSRRISRYNFMGLPEDRPGFYVYVRESDGTYWNPSFQPCQTPLDRWECRHGMGYTRFLAERAGLSAELALFVPPDDDVLLWDLTVTNNRSAVERLFLANYIEFSLYEYYKEIIGWIVLLFVAQKEYVKTLLASMHRKRLDLDGSALDVHDESTIKALREVLEGDDLAQIANALEIIPAIRNYEWDEHLLPLLERGDDTIRVSILRYLGKRGVVGHDQHIFRFFEDPSPDVRAEAVEAFCSLPLSPSTIEKVLYRNAERILFGS